MHVNRGLLFWGLALVTAGVVALAASQGWIDTSLLVSVWRLWPVILIAIGLSIVLSRTPLAVVGTIVTALVVGIAGGAALAIGPGVVSCGDPPTTSETASGAFTQPQASVTLDLSCGNAHVRLGDGTAWQAVIGTNEDDPAQLDASDGSLELRSEGGTFPFRRERQDWDVTLGRELVYDISASVNGAQATLDMADGVFSGIALDPNAASVTLDLSGSEAGDLRVSLNGGSLAIAADDETDLVGDITVNGGAVNLCVPDGTAMRVTVEGNLVGHDLDETDLIETDDTFTSEGFDDAEHQIDLLVEGNAASFDLNPEDGCE
jgi:hypothetical protein